MAGRTVSAAGREAAQRDRWLDDGAAEGARGGPEAACQGPTCERAELWRWVEQLERLAEGGLHARGLVHDLGNSLTSLMAVCELAQLAPDERALRAALERSLDLARTASRRLHAWNELTRRGHADDEGVHVAEVVEEALTLLAHPFRKAAVEVDREFTHAEGVVVHGSRAAVLQVVANAMLAVLSGAPPRAHLRVRVAALRDRAVVEVSREAGPEPLDAPKNGTGLELEVARRTAISLGGALDAVAGTDHARLELPVAVPASPRGSADPLRTWRPT